MTQTTSITRPHHLPPDSCWKRCGYLYDSYPTFTHRWRLSTRHRASTSMYWLTFRVRVTTRTPLQYGWNGTAHAAGASILSPARGVFTGMRSVRVRRAWRITAGLCHAFP